MPQSGKSEGRRACIICANSKLKCDCNRPCSRCVEKGLSLQCQILKIAPTKLPPACKACKKVKKYCDRGRPCARCVRNGTEELCCDEKGMTVTPLKAEPQVSTALSMLSVRHSFIVDNAISAMIDYAENYSPMAIADLFINTPIYSFQSLCAILQLFLSEAGLRCFLLHLQNISYTSLIGQDIVKSIDERITVLNSYVQTKMYLDNSPAIRTEEGEGSLDPIQNLSPEDQEVMHYFYDLGFAELREINPFNGRCAVMLAPVAARAPCRIYLNPEAENLFGYSTVELNNILSQRTSRSEIDSKSWNDFEHIASSVIPSLPTVLS